MHEVVILRKELRWKLTATCFLETEKGQYSWSISWNPVLPYINLSSNWLNLGPYNNVAHKQPLS